LICSLIAASWQSAPGVEGKLQCPTPQRLVPKANSRLWISS